MRMIFKRGNDDAFDLTEAALRKVVGEVRLTAATRAEWPLVAQAEDAIMADVLQLMFERPDITAIAAFGQIRRKRPLCFTISRADRVARGDDCDLVCG